MSDSRKVRAGKIFRSLKKLFPETKMALRYLNNWELLVAVILSAQCTDKKVNEVTERLFKKYRTLDDYIEVDVKEFEGNIRETGFYHNKAKNVLASATIIKEEFGGKVPNIMEEILTLPGVARKTANVVLGNAYGVIEGIAVDTHVKRFSQKLGLTKEKNPEKIERDLMKLFPKKHWFEITYLLIDYGRNICTARKHDCKNHPLSIIYPKAADTWP